MTTSTVLHEVQSPARGKLYNAFKSSPFFLVHLAPLLAIPSVATAIGIDPVQSIDWIVCVSLYWIRMFGVTGAYHRYFSHRTYKTSRAFQFLLAFLAQTSSQKGALWWAAHHRHHHKYSDMPEDTHSPVQRSMWFAHAGWMLQSSNDGTDYSKIKDLAKYPELVFLNRNWYIPPVVLGLAVWVALGWSGLLIGFFLSTVFLWHGTFTINSLSHVIGKRVYETTDDSRNHWLLAFITMGEGWHNNHHYYQASTRQGFHWWQYDFTYYILKALSWVGLVWDLREPPQAVLEGTWQPNKAGRSDRKVNETDEVELAKAA